MSGRHADRVPTQGEILYDLFRSEGKGFLATSGKKNRYHRIADTVGFLISNRRRIKIQCLGVYSGPSFLVADLSSALGKVLGQKVVLRLHGGGLPELFERRPAWARRVLKRGDAIVAPSEFLARTTRNLGFECSVIPNVIRVETYPFRERSRIEPHLFWMRSFHPIWNPEMAVKVLACLRQKGLPATLVMGGNDKGALEQVKRDANALKLDGAVRFAGFLDHAGKVREGNAAEIFINTNRVDNMPVSVVEACAMGLPIVATNVGGIPDLLRDGETGLLVPSDDVEAMARAIMQLIGNPDLVSKLSCNGRKLAEQSAWPSVKAQWLAVFRHLKGGEVDFGIKGPAT